ISTLMDNRQASEKFFVEPASKVQRPKSNVRRSTSRGSVMVAGVQTSVEEVTAEPGRTLDVGLETLDKQSPTLDIELETWDGRRPRVSQIVSLTGFSFVGGPAMNDSEAAAEYLK